MRNRGRESRTAVWSSTGILTRPKASEPFQSARAIRGGPARKRPQASGRRAGLGIRRLTPGPALGPWARILRPAFLARAERALRVDPVVEIAAVLAATLEVAVISGLGDLFVRRGRRDRSVALPRRVVGGVAYAGRRAVGLRNQGIRRCCCCAARRGAGRPAPLGRRQVCRGRGFVGTGILLRHGAASIVAGP